MGWSDYPLIKVVFFLIERIFVNPFGCYKGVYFSVIWPGEMVGLVCFRLFSRS
jgi:hypothetical protein